MNRPAIYLGNLPYSATKDDIKTFLEGSAPITVHDVRIVMGDDGRPRGFGFASLGDADEVQKAVEMIDGSTFGGRSIVVNVAKDKQGSGGGGGRPGGGGGRGGGERRSGGDNRKKGARGGRRRGSDDNEFWRS
jgi:RNA recognition motif-containing protein